MKFNHESEAAVSVNRVIIVILHSYTSQQWVLKSNMKFNHESEAEIKDSERSQRCLRRVKLRTVITIDWEIHLKLHMLSHLA
ncbi:unnamed protein product [Calypogeia fissa]